jgi:hypothetical protein
MEWFVALIVGAVLFVTPVFDMFPRERWARAGSQLCGGLLLLAFALNYDVAVTELIEHFQREAQDISEHIVESISPTTTTSTPTTNG